jgi:hypothetical protein
MGLAPPDHKPEWDDKLSNLRSQRRALGFCMTCGEKWSKQHKYPNKVSLQVLEEVLAMIQPDEGSEDTKDESSDDDEDEQVF